MGQLFVLDRNTWNYMIVRKLFVLDRNTWNYVIVCKLFVLDRNTWNYMIVRKLFVFDRNTWNYVIVCKLFVLHRNTWNYMIVWCYTSFGLLNYIFNCSFSFTLLYFQILQWLQARQNVEDASTRPILSAMCVGTSQQLHSVEPSLPSSEAYFHYFDCKVGDQDKSWAPHICCKPCYNGLTAWFKCKKAVFNFAVPMVWREPRNYADDCYLCLTNITGFNASSRKKIKYPNLWSAMKPVPHSDDLPVPTPPVNKDLLSSLDEEMPSREDSAESISLEDIESTYSGTSGTLDHARRPEWSCSWFVSVKTAVRALGFSA